MASKFLRIDIRQCWKELFSQITQNTRTKSVFATGPQALCLFLAYLFVFALLLINRLCELILLGQSHYWFRAISAKVINIQGP